MQTEQATLQPQKPPVVSVLMSVYNERPELLRRAVQSILAQTFTDFEFLILDDGSTEEATLRELDELAARDPRIRMSHEPHRGLSATLNLGLTRCRGELICRQDSDDWSEAERFKAQVEFMRAHPEIGVVGSYAAIHQEQGAPLWICEYPTTSEQVLDAFHSGNPFCHGVTCFRNAAAQAVGPYRLELIGCEDYDFFWRIAERFGGANIPQALYHYYCRRASVTAETYRVKARNLRLIVALAQQRAQGQDSDVAAAMEHVDSAGAFSDDSLAYRADRFMLAGYYRDAFTQFAAAIAQAPTRRQPYLKLARFALFVTLPPLRHRLFRTDILRLRACRKGPMRSTLGEQPL